MNTNIYIVSKITNNYLNIFTGTAAPYRIRSLGLVQLAGVCGCGAGARYAGYLGLPLDTTLCPLLSARAAG